MVKVQNTHLSNAMQIDCDTIVLDTNQVYTFQRTKPNQTKPNEIKENRFQLEILDQMRQKQKFVAIS